MRRGRSTRFAGLAVPKRREVGARTHELDRPVDVLERRAEVLGRASRRRQGHGLAKAGAERNELWARLPELRVRRRQVRTRPGPAELRGQVGGAAERLELELA